MSLPALLSNSLALASQFKYPLVFVITIVEGPILMVTAGFLLHQGFFSLVPLFIALFAGDLVGDVAWYYIGYFFAEPFLRKHGHFLSVTPETFEKAKTLFHKYHGRILLISKVTIGFGMAIATLMVAGATHVRFRSYLILNAIGEVALIALLLLIGYFFGEVSGALAKDLKIGFIIFAIIGAGFAIYGFAKYMKHKIAGL